MSENSHVNIGNTRDESQRSVYEEIKNRDECPFCIENLHKSHDQPILRTGEHWYVTPNNWPYEYTATHLLAITTYHITKPTELRPGAFDELLEHLQWAEKEYDIRAGGLAMRFGDTRLNGASVSHLHAHIIKPDVDRPAGTKVRFKIS